MEDGNLYSKDNGYDTQPKMQQTKYRPMPCFGLMVPAGFGTRSISTVA